MASGVSGFVIKSSREPRIELVGEAGRCVGARNVYLVDAPPITLPAYWTAWSFIRRRSCSSFALSVRCVSKSRIVSSKEDWTSARRDSSSEWATLKMVRSLDNFLLRETRRVSRELPMGLPSVFSGAGPSLSSSSSPVENSMCWLSESK